MQLANALSALALVAGAVATPSPKYCAQPFAALEQRNVPVEQGSACDEIIAVPNAVTVTPKWSEETSTEIDATLVHVTPGVVTNSSAHTPTSHQQPDSTETDTPEVTGGAFDPQPMKASGAGLLGFFIVSLVLL